MIAPLTSAAVAQTAASDTIVMVMARDGLQTAAAWAGVVVGVFFLLLIPLLLLLFTQVKKLNATVKALGEKGLTRVDPLVEGGKNIADNVEFVTMAVRSDVERLHGSIKSLSDRLHHASDRMEERIEEFNALMEVVQGEAKEIFIGTAATVRGVRAGARALGDGAEGPEDAHRLRLRRDTDEGETPGARPTPERSTAPAAGPEGE